jgi:peptide-methionine (S)-S-oxide reductase
MGKVMSKVTKSLKSWVMSQALPLQDNLGDYQVITLGGGCFWCTEAVFVQVQGVVDVESGYCNGHVQNPTYEQVCNGNTGHVEVVQLRYDPKVTSLRELLEIFFVIHDPTTLNRQGNDVGTQYRSGIYLSVAGDLEVAKSFVEQVNKAMNGKVVTEIEMLDNYSAAEDYHQDYFENHPNQGYCAFVVAPKVKKFLQTFSNKVRA